MRVITSLCIFLPFLLVASSRNTQRELRIEHPHHSLHSRQLPNPASNVKTITTPQNITIRYKEPGKDGCVCETTPGVNSYSGYIDLDKNTHTFFWFFEARNNPQDAPITLWLNGGPGSDSLIGLFQELGPCNVTQNLTTMVNPYSWSEVSNMLFLSQPLGTGFSYGSEGEGSISNVTGEYQSASYGPFDGRYPIINATALDTTDLAAVAAWHVLQGFLGGLPQIDGKVKSREFHLWTESYGGHYGPAFYNYFYHQNELISNGTVTGIPLNFATLGIGNGIIDEGTQAFAYPKFAVNNTYGIKAVSDEVHNYMTFALNMRNGCLDQVSYCRSLNLTGNSETINNAICSEAANMCRDNVEGPYYAYSNRGTYDIRHPQDDPTPPQYFIDFLNLASTQNALGVDLNYTMDSSNEVTYAFATTGDFVYPNFLEDLDQILDSGVRVHLYYGDADYICNWFGGEAISLAVNYTHSTEFAASGYSPFIVGSPTSMYEAGAVRQYGNFSFLRVYEAGHEVPYYQPEAALEMFRRVVLGLDVSTGNLRIGEGFGSLGAANATHTEKVVVVSTVGGGMGTMSSSGMGVTSAPEIIR